jgi:hypothetical protein
MPTLRHAAKLPVPPCAHTSCRARARGRGEGGPSSQADLGLRGFQPLQDNIGAQAMEQR